MKILVFGTGKKTVDMVIQLAMDGGNSIAHASHRGAVRDFLERSTYDILLFTECERLEETDLVAGEFVNICITPPCAVALCDAVSGFERASDYGLESIDFLLEKFSVDMCEQILQCAKDNEG